MAQNLTSNPLTDDTDDGPSNELQPRKNSTFEDVDLAARRSASIQQTKEETPQPPQTPQTPQVLTSHQSEEVSDLRALENSISRCTSIPELSGLVNRAIDLVSFNQDLHTAIAATRNYILAMQASPQQAEASSQILYPWPVMSINEWGMPQFRVLVMTATGIFRCTVSNNIVSRSSFVPYKDIKLIELHSKVDNTIAGIRQEGGFNVITTNLDGNRNPIVTVMNKLPTSKTEPGSQKNKRIYRPIVRFDRPHIEVSDLSLVVSSLIITCAKLGANVTIELTRRADVPGVSPRIPDSVRRRVSSMSTNISKRLSVSKNSESVAV